MTVRFLFQPFYNTPISDQDSTINYLAERYQFDDEVVFELSYIGGVVRRNKLSRVLNLSINEIK